MKDSLVALLVALWMAVSASGEALALSSQQAGGVGYFYLAPTTVLDRYPSDFLLRHEFEVNIGAARLFDLIVDVNPDTPRVNVRVYVFEHIVAECVVFEGASRCLSGAVDLTSPGEALPLADRILPIRVESDVDYTLTVRALVAVPAPHVAFLAQIGR